MTNNVREQADVEWVQSKKGFYHVCAFTENALIMGFPQKKPEVWPTFGALIIRRSPVGVEPEIVALKNEGDTFKVVKTYTLDDPQSNLYDWSFQTLNLALPMIVREWEEWAPYIHKLFESALIEGVKSGKVVYSTPDEGFEA